MFASAWNWWSAFAFFSAGFSVSAALSHITDCDEVFNYWEPAHFLTYRNGFQTWEYSPEYALRSWVYILLHALPGLLLREIIGKLLIFYLTRVLLSLLSAYCVAHFYIGIVKSFGAVTANLTAWLLLCSVGLYISVSAFLPSSFSMCLTALAYGHYMQVMGTAQTSSPVQGHQGRALFFSVFSTLLGWPFVGALALPMCMCCLFDSFWRTIRITIVSVLCCTAAHVALDSWFYGKLVIAPLNIVLYNFTVKEGAGSQLYGVEPWFFYLINGVLNWNIVLPLALLGVFAALVPRFNARFLILAAAPMYLWLLIMSLPPHKEERFLFPAYPFIALNAAFLLSKLFARRLVVLPFHSKRAHFTRASCLYLRCCLAARCSPFRVC
jgi:alpha-1,2-mannosyltransferase